MVNEITDEQFKNEVINCKTPVVVDFWAPWCGPCKMLGPVFEKVSSELKTVKFLKINVDEQQTWAQEFGVMSIPTMLLFKDGEEVGRAVGALSESQLKTKLKEVFK